ncbi:MAG: hypothetical protein R2932_06715 [Caldilineaceae bacterium]
MFAPIPQDQGLLHGQPCLEPQTILHALPLAERIRQLPLLQTMTASPSALARAPTSVWRWQAQAAFADAKCFQQRPIAPA